MCHKALQHPKSKISKLMTTLYNKSKYIMHYRNLKQCLEHGLKLIKIHRVLAFEQSPWLKSYIEFNTKLRAAATTTFEKNLFKLIINAVFGKTMENIRKHRVVKLVTRWEGRYGAKNLIASPNFHNRTIFNDNLVAIELTKNNHVFNKPIYVGMVILDISKVCLYSFHYSYMLKKCTENNQVKLLYTDTDSLIYQLKNIDPYQDIIKKDIHKFDTSDYAQDNSYNIPLANKKIPGLMKDELNGKIMTHFIGLRSKMYTYKYDGEEGCVKKSKGVKKNVMETKINFNDYLECLRNSVEKMVSQRTIRSFAHTVYSIEQNKIALNGFDDKRYLIKNSTDTLPHGHYLLKDS